MESGEVMGASNGASGQWQGDMKLPCRLGWSSSGNHDDHSIDHRSTRMPRSGNHEDGIDHHRSTEMPTRIGRLMSEPSCNKFVVPDRGEVARRDATPLPGGIRPRDDEPPLAKRVRFAWSIPNGEQTQLLISPLTQLKLYENGAMDWVRRERIDEKIAAMGKILFHQPELISSAAISESDISTWMGKAHAILAEQISVGVFSDNDLDMDLVYQDQVGVALKGLVPYLLERRKVHQFKGLNEQELESRAEGFEQAALLLDLKKEGQRSFVTPEFVPNGGRNFQQSKSYRENAPLCNRHIFKLLVAGKAVIVSWDTLTDGEKSESACQHSAACAIIES